MNILFTYTNLLNPTKGGVGRVADTLARYFVMCGYKMYYLNSEFNVKDDYAFPAEVYTLPNPIFNSKSNRQFYHSLLNKLAIDVIVNHDASNNSSKLWLNIGDHPAKKISIYHTAPLHGLNRGKSYGHFANIIIRKLRVIKYRIALKSLLKNTDKLVVLSEQFKKGIQKELGISSSKIVSISNPCVFNKYHSEIKKKQVLFVGRIDWYSKRTDKMLSIWSRLFNKHPDWELLILGDGPDRKKTETLAKKLQLGNVLFKGFVNPETFYEQASIICLTSNHEGFPMVLPEAMHYGVVPIAFNNWASLTDVIQHEETGLVVDSNDMDDFVIKLDYLMSNEKERKRMALNAKAYVQKFHVDVIGLQWMELIKLSMDND